MRSCCLVSVHVFCASCDAELCFRHAQLTPQAGFSVGAGLSVTILSTGPVLWHHVYSASPFLDKLCCCVALPRGSGQCSLRTRRSRCSSPACAFCIHRCAAILAFLPRSLDKSHQACPEFLSCCVWLSSRAPWKWKWNLMGCVSILMRLTQHRSDEPIIVALTPECSWRATGRTLLAEQAQACGRLTQGGRAGGPDSTRRG